MELLVWMGKAGKGMEWAGAVAVFELLTTVEREAMLCTEEGRPRKKRPVRLTGELKRVLHLLAT